MDDGPAVGAGDPVPTWPDPAGWEDQLARLLRRPENLRSVYQPVVDMRTGECAGFEALTRVAEWPAQSPQPWFQAALRSGLAAQLEAAALVTSLRSRADLPSGTFLCVNVAPSALSHPSVTQVLLDQGDLRGLVVELDEGEPLLGDTPEVTALAALRERGLAVALDVGDAGLAELDAVRHVRPDLVKLARSLVCDVHGDSLRARLVRLAVSTAEDAGSAVVAVGVETLEDARFLQYVGVRLAQGWLFGRARPGFLAPSPEVTSWVRASWEEAGALTGVGRLAVPVARAGEGSPDGVWVADVDPEGRLRGLRGPGGRSVGGHEVLRLRARMDLRAAAQRMVGAGGAQRRTNGLVAVEDDDGRFVGLLDPDALLREVLGTDGDLTVPAST